MSMNLHCNKMDLWQTPTWVTDICMSINPKTNKPDGGHNGIRRRYIRWVESHVERKFYATDIFNELEKNIRIHLKELLSCIRPRFYVL